MNTLADALLQEITDRLAGARPRVRALHLPPVPLVGHKAGEFAAVELDDGTLGLGYVLLDGALARLADEAARTPGGSDALALARRWRDGDGAERALGFAAVNALSRWLMDRSGQVPPDAPDSIAGLAPQPGEHLGMVGFFPPLVKQVAAHGARLTVLELRSDLVADQPHCTVTQDPAALAGCRKLLITSTTLLNHTLDGLLPHVGQASQIALVGPGASCLPGPLFARGITALAGLWVQDGPALAAALRAGQPWGAHARKTLLLRP